MPLLSDHGRRLQSEVTKLKGRLRRAQQQAPVGMASPGQSRAAALSVAELAAREPVPLLPHDRPARMYLDQTEYLDSGTQCNMLTIAPQSILLRLLLFLEVWWTIGRTAKGLAV